MKKQFFSSMLMMVFSIASNAQVKDATQHIKQQAEKMGAAFLASDYKTFASFTYPEIVKAMGGPAKMVETLEKSINDMKGVGMSFTKISFDDPSKLIRQGSEWQSTIPQHLEIKLKQGRVVTTSTLIAFSRDNGANWTFIDTSNKDIATLRKVLPNLSPSITIPPQQPPVKYDN